VVEPGTASEEKILVTRTGSTDTTINVASDSVRGQDGTSAVAHSTGSTVFPVFTSVDADEANAVASVISADTTNGRVGIGTATPAEELHIVKDQNGDLTQVLIENLDQRVRVGSYYEAGVGQYAKIQSENDAGGDLALVLNPEGGNVGIGTTSPQSNLHVSSTATSLELQDSDGTVGGNITSRILFTGSARATQGILGFSGTASGTMVVDNYDGNTLLRTNVAASPNQWTFANNGNTTFPAILVSIGTYNNTTGAGANMHISSGGFFYRSTSSIKYKTDVETLDDDHANIIFRLRPVWYRSTTGNDPAGWSYYGLIAEEVAEVDPRLVHFGASTDCTCPKDDEGNLVGDHDVSCLTEPEGVQYDRLVPHLISVVQRQQAQIDALEARLAALEAK
jgi:hypothetical protein